MTDIIPALSFTAPIHDKRFVRLSDEARDLVIARLAAMQTIAKAKSVEEGVKEVASANPGRRGFGQGTIRNCWFRFKLKNGYWVALLDRALAGPAWWGEDADGEELTQAFREHLGTLWSRRQRGKFRAAYSEKLIPQWRRWRAGDASAAIPGYQTCPEPNPLTDLPDGWTEGNLRRIARAEASIAARKLVNIGPKSGQQYTYKIPKTREGVEVGQILFPDDCWNDFRITWQGKGSRIISLHMLDLASGCNPIRGHKPTCEDERGVEQRLKEKEMIFLLDAYFSTHGYHPAGTEIYCEKSTATVRPEDESMLEILTDGKIKIRRGPMGGGPGISGLFTGPGGGNPNWKAPLESWFNLLHNRCDDMIDFPGQAGKNSRLDKPEGLELMERTDEALHRALQVLTPERQKLIKFNLLQYEHAAPAIDSMCEVINTRRDHKLNQWAACGNIIPAFRLTETTPWIPWTELDRLTPDQQAHVQFLLRQNPRLCGEINLSPREVFNRGAGKLIKFNPSQRALLLAKLEGKEKSVSKGGLLELELPEIDQRNPVRYGPVWRDFDGNEVALRHGDKYLTRVNGFKPKSVWLYNAAGGFVGIAAARLNAAGYHDAEALNEHHKAKSKQFAPILAEARKIAAPINTRASEIVDNNARVFASQKKEANDLAAAASAALFRGNAES